MSTKEIANDILSFSFIIQSITSKIFPKLISAFNAYIAKLAKFESFLPQATDVNIYESLGNSIQIKDIDSLMRNINQSVFKALEDCNINEEIENLFDLINQIKEFTTQMVYKHINYNNCDYYGEVINEITKEGTGVLISQSLIMLGVFEQNVFKRGIILNQEESTIAKGEILNDKSFDGVIINYSKDNNQLIESCSFGLWQSKKPIHETRFEFLRKEGLITINNDNYMIKYNKNNANDLFVIFDKERISYDKGQYLVVDKNIMWMKFASGVYSGTYNESSITSFKDGIFVYKNGDYYIGHFEGNIKQGKGTYFEKERCILIEGIFNEDTVVNGNITKEKQVIFTGDFNPTGDIVKGSYKYDNGDRYEGMFKSGKRDGKGIYITRINNCDNKNEEEITIECDWSKDQKNGIIKDYNGFSIVFNEGEVDRVYYK